MNTKTVIIAVAFAATIGHNVAEGYLSNHGSKYNVESFYGNVYEPMPLRLL